MAEIQFKKFWISLTRDLIGVYLEVEAESEEAVRNYLHKHYRRDGVWMLPWCAVYDKQPEPRYVTYIHKVHGAICS